MNTPKPISLGHQRSVPLEFFTEFEKGVKLLAAGQELEAESRFRNCAKACPEAWLGVACESLAERREREALDRFQQVMEFATHPKTRAVCLNNIGTLLCNRGLRLESEKYFRESFSLWKHADSAANIGLALLYQCRIEEAIKWVNRAIDLDPRNHQLYFTRSLIKLLSGDLVGGFSEYESRWKNPASKCTRLPVFRPEWNGGSLAGKTLMVYGEQGAGDTIQMMRYLPLLKQRGARVLIAPQKGLGRLCEHAGFDGVYEDMPERVRSGNVPAYDLQVATMSLPRIFSGVIPPPLWNRPWRYENERPKVAFAWAGSIDHAHDRWRSTQFEQWQTLFALDCDFYSFQFGQRAFEFESAMNVMEARAGDYLATGEQLAEMDLVICVDTSLAHLAGSLGIPTWILLPFAPDWRWMLNRDDSPWYPSARLFRQPAIDDWDSVFRTVQRELSGFLNEKAAMPAFGLVP